MKGYLSVTASRQFRRHGQLVGVVARVELYGVESPDSGGEIGALGARLRGAYRDRAALSRNLPGGVLQKSY